MKSINCGNMRHYSPYFGYRVPFMCWQKSKIAHCSTLAERQAYLKLLWPIKPLENIITPLKGITPGWVGIMRVGIMRVTI